jgi:hypothetical protein
MEQKRDSCWGVSPPDPFAPQGYAREQAGSGFPLYSSHGLPCCGVPLQSVTRNTGSCCLFVAVVAIVGCTQVSTGDKGEALSIETNGTGPSTQAKHAYADVVDSLSSLQFDTSTSEGKRKHIMNQFLIEWGGLGPEYDTLLDLNYDGVDDYAIGWYGLAGNGLKHNWNVFIWEPRTSSYHADTNLTGLPNASFFSRDSLITSFYIAYGGGYGEQWEWQKGDWRQTMTFYVENKEDNSDWLLTYPRTGKKKTIRHPYQGIPPARILRTRYLRSPIDG